MNTMTAPELNEEEREQLKRFDYLPDAIALDEGFDFVQAGHLRILDRFEFEALTWSKPRVLECWGYPYWSIVHGEVLFECRRILANGEASLEEPFIVSAPAAMWLKVVTKP